MSALRCRRRLRSRLRCPASYTVAPGICDVGADGAVAAAIGTLEGATVRDLAAFLDSRR